jgi:hypothetical protein
MLSVTQNDPLAADIVAINRLVLSVIARYSHVSPEDVCLRLNMPTSWIKSVQALSSEKIAELAHLDQFLFQPAIDSSVLEDCAQFPLEQAKAHMRSATRLKIR